ncbi:M20 family metallopeptidase [Cupriavidus sp. a3]|uniref:M20 family metallopeptidase n=1 Tax=Cupriavidus sp. a3 TaxID=3242158 RepID=UPI003D9C106D
MSRQTVLQYANHYYESGRFTDDLARRIAYPTESPLLERRPVLRDYLLKEMVPTLASLGYTSRILDNPVDKEIPFLLASREEGPELPTLLTYGHGDVVRGLAELWDEGLSPWELRKVGDRFYGRGTADNKAQHSIVIGALEAVLKVRGNHGFNSKILIDMGEEIGSPGLTEVVENHARDLQADIFIASDGPRLKVERPDIKLGNRGMMAFDLVVDLRDGSRHSGHWGGVLEDPGIILANALARIADKRGKILVPNWCPASGIPPAIKAALTDCYVDPGPDFPHIAADWGEPGLSRAEKMFGWTSFIVLAFLTGQPDEPVNGVQPWARASCQLRFSADMNPKDFLPALRKHLDEEGFEQVEIMQRETGFHPASRTDPENQWVRWAVDSIASTMGAKPIVVPNGAGSLPSEVFARHLGVPTVWVPHSYTGCKQHGPNEHVLGQLMNEGLRIMAGLFWDLGEAGPEKMAPKNRV